MTAPLLPGHATVEVDGAIDEVELAAALVEATWPDTLRAPQTFVLERGVPRPLLR